MYYQKRYNFELNPDNSHRTWNVEADVFKHSFMSADLALKGGNLASTAIGIYHESQTPSNPKGEWNMDSWNNSRGRNIANEIRKEYGIKFYTLSQQEKDDIIADKVMKKMYSGELITHPGDNRQFKGPIETFVNQVSNSKGKTTGYASSVAASLDQSYTAEQIGNMTQEEFDKNEGEIMR